MAVIDWLLRTSDHFPQLIGTFENSAVTVNIAVWDITGGQNALMSIANSGCYSIGYTGRWGWSTAYLPSTQGHAKQYAYTMISDTSETFDGQLILDTPENAKWIYPDNSADYLR